MNWLGYKGGRIKRNREKIKLRQILEKHKNEIIDFAVDEWESYSPEWLARQMVEALEDLSENTTSSQLEEIFNEWDEEIVKAIKDSFEPSARTEALRELERDTINNILKNQQK